MKFDAFHDQVHGIFIDKMMYDFGNSRRFWLLRLLCMVEEIFLGFELGLKVFHLPILYEVICTDENTGSVVGIVPGVLFFVLSARGYHLGL